MLQAPAWPDCLFASFLSLLMPLTPIVLRFILSHFLYVVLCPKADLDLSQRLRRGNRYFFLSHPAMERVPTNIEKRCDVSSRISLHLYDRMTHTVCQAENLTVKERFRPRRPGQSIAFQNQNAKRPWDAAVPSGRFGGRGRSRTPGNAARSDFPEVLLTASKYGLAPTGTSWLWRTLCARSDNRTSMQRSLATPSREISGIIAKNPERPGRGRHP